MDLSIIIVNWRSAALVRRCLQSVYSNTSGVEFEVVVVDNASFDGCEEMLAREFSHVHFLQTRENIGFACANNLAVAHSCGDAVLFLNPDTEVVGNAISTLWSQLQAHQDAGAVGAKLLNSDLSVQTSCIQAFPTILNQLLDTEYLRHKFPTSRLWGMWPLFRCLNGSAEVECISGACLMMRRRALDQVGGGFDPIYFMYAEDIDLCQRMKVLGWKRYFIAEACVVHHGGRSSDSQRNNFSAVMMRQSLFKYMQAWHGNVNALMYRFTVILVAVVRLMLASLGDLVAMDNSKSEWLRAARTKWTAILHWGLGLGSSRERTVPARISIARERSGPTM
jgi:hypothetical protein